ncbi:MAG: hypothetical protein ABI220_02260 [Candidatus Saccharimonadales bacterium]
MAKQFKPIRIIIYRMTGKQLFFRVPESVCLECDMSVGLVRSAVKELNIENDVEIIVKPWFNNIISCLFWHSWHPPIVTINGQRFSQGVVPNRAELIANLQNHLKLKNKRLA